ncbi:hypothetical protein M5D96_008414 [Drosophila gunungcola]|uniref:MADF domain-containing protein n=1 Tax=Drosophila gunungcola TaxID=103775 RepID=A0A9P9YK74_9MUSC|nr:hypothetical protein M5D96_008414 [Drosophila gunungcola]
MAPKGMTSHSKMERLERTQKLIRLYRSNECLWNPKSPGFHSDSVKEDAWQWITRQMKCGLTPDQVKLQVFSLRNYYSKECAAIRLSQRKGFSYAPRHSYFEDLQFLGNLDFEESKECKASFSQLNCLLEDVLVLDDCSSIKANYHPAFSEATFCEREEPEPDQEEHIRSYKERATSGNDRWYPTTYCVQCNQNEGPRLCGQHRQKYVPRGRKEVPDGRKSGSGRWKRNNDAICRRLQDRLAKQENPHGSYFEEGDSDQDQNCSYKHSDRRESGEDQLNPSSVKNNPSPKIVKSTKVQSRSASPIRHLVTPRTQPGEPTKKAPATAKTGGPSSAKKPTMDTNAAANSKLPFDLKSAAYFICKLQDEGNNHKYLLVVPKKPIGRPDGQRMGSGQASGKQLHCQRQCSGFQSVSWTNPSLASQSQRSQQFPPSEEGLSVLGSFSVPPLLANTALGIIKEHLNRTIMAPNPGVLPLRKMRRTLLSRPRRPVLRPSHKANAPILDENRTLLLTNNPFRNLTFGDNQREVIVLHPPDPGFRPSKNSFSKDEVEVQHITVQSEDPGVNPKPPKPPIKPKQKVPR